MVFNDSQPIYIQIIDDIKAKIVKGEYQPGQRIESVRDMAIAYGINPNTIQKALAECEKQMLLYNLGPQGRFISEDIQLIEQLKFQQQQAIIDQCLQLVKHNGIDVEVLIDALRSEYERGKNDE